MKIAAAIIIGFSLILPFPAVAAIAFGAAATWQDTVTTSPAVSLNVSGSHTAIFLTTAYCSNPATSTCTVNGAAMTYLGGGNNTGATQGDGYYFMNPPAGNDLIQCTTGHIESSGGASYYTGVSSTTPEGTPLLVGSTTNSQGFQQNFQTITAGDAIVWGVNTCQSNVVSSTTAPYTAANRGFPTNSGSDGTLIGLFDSSSTPLGGNIGANASTTLYALRAGGGNANYVGIGAGFVPFTVAVNALIAKVRIAIGQLQVLVGGLRI